MAEIRRETLTRKYRLHIYHRLPRLRLALTKSDVDEALRYGEERGWKLESVTLWDRYTVYPRFGRLKDGRVVLPAYFVEYNRLRADGIYTFTITYLVPLPPPLQTIHMKIKPYALVYKEPTPLKREYEKRFECTYNIDTLRNSETGEIHRNDPLTRTEIEVIWDDFLTNFRWTTFPPGTIETAEGWTTEFEFTNQAKGAFLKAISVREDGVETYHQDFDPPIRIYEVSEEENKEFLKRAGKSLSKEAGRER